MEFKISKYGLVASLGLFITACSGVSFTPSPDSPLAVKGLQFKESFGFDKPGGGRPLDILFVIDNSPSMAPLQQNLANNMTEFMSAFIAKGSDFHLSIATSDSYLDRK